MKMIDEFLNKYCTFVTGIQFAHVAKYILLRELTFEETANLLREGDPFPHTWYIQKDNKIFTDE